MNARKTKRKNNSFINLCYASHAHWIPFSNTSSKSSRQSQLPSVRRRDFRVIDRLLFPMTRSKSDVLQRIFPLKKINVIESITRDAVRRNSFFFERPLDKERLLRLTSGTNIFMCSQGKAIDELRQSTAKEKH